MQATHRSKRLLISIIFTILITACSSSGSSSAESGNGSVAETPASATALWARTTSAAPNSSQFNGVAVDATGNIYAVGYQTTNGTFTYGSQSVTGSHTNFNAVIVKYDSSGGAQWARSTTAGAGNSRFTGVAADSSGNVYAVGYQFTGSFTYSGQSAAGTTSSNNPIIVKYDSSGTALWARSISAGASSSVFYAVAVDSAGNAYVTAGQAGTGTYTYGGQSVAGTYSNANAVLVKYDSSGAGLWVRSVSTGANTSRFWGVTVDTTGNVFIAGSQTGTGTYTYGTQSIAGSGVGPNSTLIKYDSAGNALWARTTAAGAASSEFNTVAVDSSGNIYVGGYQSGNNTVTYGSQAVAGTSTSQNVVLLKYDSTGAAQWGQTLNGGATGATKFSSIAVDTSGNIYAAGYQNGTETFTFGNRNLTGTSANNNLILIKYSNSGSVTWATTVTGGTNGSEFTGVAINSAGNAHGVGYQSGTSTYNHAGQGATGAGTSSNSVVVKYQ